MASKPPARVYEFRCVFHAPLPYVYWWLTDYTPDDKRLQGLNASRRIVRKSARQVICEDLEVVNGGWEWSRQTVTLRPPDRWTATSVGNYRSWDLDYRLKPLPDGSTEFHFRGTRRPMVLGERNPPKGPFTRKLQKGWASFARALDRDWRARRKGAEG